ncbi:MAG: hypothetical protein GXP52_02530 [Deltaproteobacteria bacterium]|nr:hypothetical protein [Deltaproteobacteria bacterium]
MLETGACEKFRKLGKYRCGWEGPWDTLPGMDGPEVMVDSPFMAPGSIIERNI